MNIEKIKKFQEEGILRKNFNNLQTYALIIDYIQTLNISYKNDGSYRFYDNVLDINGECVGNKFTGQGIKIHKNYIKDCIKKFNEKYKDILELIK